jgi:hypothetical protein
MALPVQIYEVIPAFGGTYILRIVKPSAVTVGPLSLPEGRQVAEIRTYPNLNQLKNDLTLLESQPPIA